MKKLDPGGLHLAFLDPYNLATLSFDLIEGLSKVRTDILLHLSISDLRRNVGLYASDEYSQFDLFAPGWRKAVDVNVGLDRLRSKVIEYWMSQTEKLGYPPGHWEMIRGPKSVGLYCLVLLSKHSLGRNLWSKITSPAKQPLML